MKKLICTACSFALVACLGPSPEDKFFNACDLTIKERLKAPSTYKVLSRTQVAYSPLTFEWEFKLNSAKDVADFKQASDPAKPWPSGYMRATTQEQIEAARKRHKLQKISTKLNIEAGYQIATSFIKYEAANSYGTPIASIYTCETDASSPDRLMSSKLHQVRVNGMTKFEWLLSNL